MVLSPYDLSYWWDIIIKHKHMLSDEPMMRSAFHRKKIPMFCWGANNGPAINAGCDFLGVPDLYF